jgi:hypothetical protein
VKASEQPDSDRNSSASFVDIVGLRQRRLICSGCKCLLAPNDARIIGDGPVIWHRERVDDLPSRRYGTDVERLLDRALADRHTGYVNPYGATGLFSVPGRAGLKGRWHLNHDGRYRRRLIVRWWTHPFKRSSEAYDGISHIA